MQKMKRMTFGKALILGSVLFLIATGSTCDRDGDGYPNESTLYWISGYDYNGQPAEYYIDCDDNDRTVHPDATEICDGKDNDCDDDIPDNELDVDGDLYLACEDCDDADPLINPGQEELCDGVDNNCDGVLMDGEEDSNGNGILDCEEQIIIEAVVNVDPDSFKLNSGSFPVYVLLPDGYDPADIIECYANDAAAVSIKVEGDVAICKFNRDDVAAEDSHFEVWGLTVDGVKFIGADDVK